MQYVQFINNFNFISHVLNMLSVLKKVRFKIYNSIQLYRKFFFTSYYKNHYQTQYLNFTLFLLSCLSASRQLDLSCDTSICPSIVFCIARVRVPCFYVASSGSLISNSLRTDRTQLPHSLIFQITFDCFWCSAAGMRIKIRIFYRSYGSYKDTEIYCVRY